MAKGRLRVQQVNKKPDRRSGITEREARQMKIQVRCVPPLSVSGRTTIRQKKKSNKEIAVRYFI